eukprot:SAG11_NODE_3342_length_2512_cov_2.717364_1_plen_93_part_10
MYVCADTDFVPRSYVESEESSCQTQGGTGCQVHSIFIDDSAMHLYYGFQMKANRGYSIRRIDLDGDTSSDVSVLDGIWYERPEYPQYIASFAI